MTKRVLDYDPITGMTCYVDYEKSTDRMILTHEQDIQPILDANKRAANDQEKTKRGMKNDWWKYASVPAVVQVEWANKYGVKMWDKNHDQAVFRLLNHPDYKYLKTTDKVHTIANG